MYTTEEDVNIMASAMEIISTEDWTYPKFTDLFHIFKYDSKYLLKNIIFGRGISQA